MFKFLINTAISSVLLSVVYVLIALFVGDQIHIGYVFIAIISAAICTPGPWFSIGSPHYAIPRAEALQWCGDAFDQWPEQGPLPLPPEGWTWMSSNLNKKPVLVAWNGLITQGDWHDGF